MINGLKKAFKKVGRMAAPYIAAGILAFAPGCGGGGGGGGTPHPDSPPVLASISDQVTPANTLYSFNENTDQGTDYDQDGDTVTYQKISGPSFLSVNSTNGVISGTPSQSDLGPQTVTVQGTDQHSNLSAPVSYNLLVTSQTTNKTGTLEYIILTDNTLAATPELQDFALRKTREGKPCQVFTVEGINGDSTYDTARDLQEKIRWFLQDQKVTHPEFSYLWIVGDDTIVPSRKVYCKSSPASGGIECSTVASDLYYIDLFDASRPSLLPHDYNWDEEVDDIFGKPSDNLEMYSDIYGTRLPAKTSAQVVTNLSKQDTVRNTTDTSFIKSMTACAAMSDATTNSAIEVDYTVNTTCNFPALGWTADRWYEKQNEPPYLPYYSGYNGAGLETLVNVINALDSGPNLAVISGQSGIADFDAVTGDFANGDADALTNTSKPSTYYFITCSTGDFSYTVDDCIAERLLNNPNGGAVAVIAPSWLTFYSPVPPVSNYYSSIGWRIANKWFNNVINGNIAEFGESFATTKDYYATFVSDLDIRSMVLDLNALGAAPDMRIRKDSYGTLNVTSSPAASYIEYTVTSSGTPVANAEFTITTSSGDNISAQSNSSGNVLFSVNPADITSTYTDKQDYVPYENP